MMTEFLCEERPNVDFRLFSKGDLVYFIHPYYPNFFVRKSHMLQVIKEHGLGPFLVLRVGLDKYGDFLQVEKSTGEKLKLSTVFLTKDDDLLKNLSLIPGLHELFSGLSN